MQLPSFQCELLLSRCDLTILENVVLSMDIGRSPRTIFRKMLSFRSNDRHTWLIECCLNDDHNTITTHRWAWRNVCAHTHLIFFCMRIRRSFPQTTGQIQQINRRISLYISLYFFHLLLPPLYKSIVFLFSEWNHCLRFAKYLWTAAFWLSSIFSPFDICLCMLLSFAFCSFDSAVIPSLRLCQSFCLLVHLKTSVEKFLDSKQTIIDVTAAAVVILLLNMKYAQSVHFKQHSNSWLQVQFHFYVTHMFRWPNMMLIADTSNNLE